LQLLQVNIEFKSTRLSTRLIKFIKLKLILIYYRSNYIRSRGSTGNLIHYLQSNHPAKWRKKIAVCSIEQFLTDSDLLVNFFIALYWLRSGTNILPDQLYSRSILVKTYSVGSL